MALEFRCCLSMCLVAIVWQLDIRQIHAEKPCFVPGDPTSFTETWTLTKSGHTCQRWDSQTPQAHNSYKEASEFPDKTLDDASNNCRDPDGYGSLWCYTTDSEKRWEVCDLPACKKPCFVPDDPESFDKTWTLTKSGKRCQRWDSQTPHAHGSYKEASEFPDKTLDDASNNCRDPDGYGSLWCYTTDSEKRWEVCDLPKCETCVVPGDPESFDKTWSLTKSGKRCQRWDSQTPQAHNSYKEASEFPDKTLDDASNNCRDPDGYGSLWCYTTDSKKRWEVCDLPACKKPCFVPGDLTSFTETWSLTKSGKRCQRWDSQTPQAHGSYKEASEFPDKTLDDASNNCRDPDGYGSLWCYTTDSEKRWEVCDLPACKKPCFVPGDLTSFTETWSLTKSGKRCQRWDSQTPQAHGSYKEASEFPDKTLDDASNNCRDPDGYGSLWCYTTDSEKRWEVCELPECEKPCFVPNDLESFDKTWTLTKSGKRCQRWDSQTPHAHGSYKEASEFPDKTLDDASNNCRDPDGYGSLWCYTTDSEKRWEVCELPECEKPCVVPGDPKSFDKTWTLTKSGKRCQRWDSQTPQAHSSYKEASEFPDKTLDDASNNCRDPGKGYGALWCYTTEDDTRWEECELPKCQKPCVKPGELTSFDKTWTLTKSGKRCQRWDSQTPQVHGSYKEASEFPDKTLNDASNNCRDPDGYGSLWCYTTDSEKRWEVCDIPECAQESNEKRKLRQLLKELRSVYTYDGRKH